MYTALAEPHTPASPAHPGEQPAQSASGPGPGADIAIATRLGRLAKVSQQGLPAAAVIGGVPGHDLEPLLGSTFAPPDSLPLHRTVAGAQLCRQPVG